MSRKLYKLIPPKSKHTSFWHMRIFFGKGKRIQRSTHCTVQGGARQFVYLYLRQHHRALHDELVTLEGTMDCEPKVRPAPGKSTAQRTS